MVRNSAMPPPPVHTLLLRRSPPPPLLLCRVLPPLLSGFVSLPAFSPFWGGGGGSRGGGGRGDRLDFADFREKRRKRKTGKPSQGSPSLVSGQRMGGSLQGRRIHLEKVWKGTLLKRVVKSVNRFPLHCRSTAHSTCALWYRNCGEQQALFSLKKKEGRQKHICALSKSDPPC